MNFDNMEELKSQTTTYDLQRRSEVYSAGGFDYFGMGAEERKSKVVVTDPVQMTRIKKQTSMGMQRKLL